MNLKFLLLLVVIKFNLYVNGQSSTYQIALAKYNGGGDWYANPTALPNLIQFCNENLNTNIQEQNARRSDALGQFNNIISSDKSLARNDLEFKPSKISSISLDMVLNKLKENKLI